MIVQLYISGVLIEEHEVDVLKCSGTEERKERVEAMSMWIQYHYHDALVIKSDWEIVAIAESKMNSNPDK